MMGLFNRSPGKSEPGPASGPPSSGFPPLSVAPLDYNRFEFADVVAWRAALDAYGFVVLAGVLSPAEVSAATSLLWDYLEERTRGDRSDPGSWGDWPAESFRYGMVQGGAHCDGAWFVRGLAGVRTAFARLFGSRRLHVSFDGFSALRPLPAAGPVARDWYHVDHALGRRGRWLAQGFVALTPSDAEDGGLVVWPCSHHLHPHWREARTDGGEGSEALNDFVMLKGHPDAASAMPRDAAGLGPVKVCVAPGDLVLWDSRTVHCNAPLGPIPGVAPGVPSLAHLAAVAGRLASAKEDASIGTWSALPAVAQGADATACACAACRGTISTRPSAPLGRLGVYVCMQPAELTDASPLMREVLVRHQALTGHVPFRDVHGIGQSLGESEVQEEELKLSLPRLVQGCRVRRELAGLKWDVNEATL